MSVRRHYFPVRTDTGTGANTYTDSGPPFFGQVGQIAWDATALAGDTGTPGASAKMVVTLEPSGLLVGSYDNSLGSAFTKVPSQPIHDTGGAEIAGAYERIYSAGEHLKVVVTDTGEGSVGGKSGTLRIWTVNDQ